MKRARSLLFHESCQNPQKLCLQIGSWHCELNLYRRWTDMICSNYRITQRLFYRIRFALENGWELWIKMNFGGWITCKVKYARLCTYSNSINQTFSGDQIFLVQLAIAIPKTYPKISLYAGINLFRIWLGWCARKFHIFWYQSYCRRWTPRKVIYEKSSQKLILRGFKLCGSSLNRINL